MRCSALTAFKGLENISGTGILGMGLKNVMLEYLAAEFLEFSQFGCLSDLNGGLF